MISIILPVYNTERYLPETIDSILNQSYTDFELIAINDGSTDQSLSILKEYAEKDARVRLIDKPNSGVSDTRNRGISVSKGDYLCFIDADDIIAKDYLELLYKTICGHNADMVVCGYKTFHGSISFTDQQSSQSSEKEIAASSDLLKMGLMTSSCIKMIRKQIITDNNIEFDCGMTFGEDLFFCWKCFYAAKSVWMIDNVLYGYRQSPESSTGKYHPDIYVKYKKAFEDLKYFKDRIDSKQLSEDENNYIDLYFTKRLPTFIFMKIRERCGILQKKKDISGFLNDDVIHSMLTDRWPILSKDLSKGETALYTAAKKNRIWHLMFYGYRLEFRIVLSKIKSKLGGLK
ncbi:MAG: glycosyltransferase family 2 protein [Clostridia bacterium]|nr:glycosyltransferase family 2 protein [Clostridia bacterium]